MAKTIIGIRGQPNSGKTEAMTLAYQELAKEGEILCYNPRSDAKELKNILEIGGVKLGFVSAGDEAERLRKSLRFLHDHGCPVIVCAARLDRFGEPCHKTIEVAEEFGEEKGFELHWIHEERNWSDRRNANREAADKIVAKVRETCSAFIALRIKPGDGSPPA